MVVPSFAALLSDTAWKGSCYRTPVLGAVFIYHQTKDLILVLGPGSLWDEGVILQFEPSIEALDLGSALHTFANLIPPLISELINQGEKLGILFSELNPDPYLLRGPHLLLPLSTGVGSLWVVVILCVKRLLSFGRALCLLERETRSCRVFNHILFVNLVGLASPFEAWAPNQVSRGILWKQGFILVQDWLLKVDPQCDWSRFS
jgi:hypothetical protein